MTNNLPTTKSAVIGVLGLGRLGCALVESFSSIGCEVVPYGRQTQPEDLHTWVRSCTVCCLAARDQQIPDLVRKLADCPLKGKVVLIHSGTLPLASLEPLAAQGAITGKLHPLQTFSKAQYVLFSKDTPFAFEGDIREIAEVWVEAWEGNLHQVTGDQWLTYHLAAVVSANFLPLFIRSGGGLLTKLTKNQQDALNWLGPLIRSSVENALDGNHLQPFSGPAIRGDRATLKSHENYLKEHAPELLELYQIASKKIAAQVPEVEEAGDAEQEKNANH